ncbi:ABC transporter, substrate-binding protein [Brevibacterium mcbrellneri ATCC 49030]|uniref:ABC transporter, substrate-binding protein n=1 Tax=Brevibacterium mcbrellneri ATCC 49030 TaxID=585530 RepID=D4YMN7_9MICO|nr:zinc ABC transporter substrate-binding protein [Brevibacterium mcbrellneri]EFG47555.1 ABC transporter, substrate-binding protein [Brevibacterium mcbrellneri ATCC 49030]
MKSLRIASVAVCAAGALVLSACGSQSGDSGGDKLNVVTSTNVYADIAQTVGGDAVDVTPIIDDASKDPHSYEATTEDQLKLSKADVVVQNGGGYDAFMTTLLEASDSEPEVVDAVSVSGLPGSAGLSNEPHGHEGHDHGEEGHEGHDHGEEGHEGHDHEHGEEDHDHEGHDHGAFNEHVWYSVPTMIKLVDEVAETMSEKSPEHKDEFTKNADDLRGKLEELNKKITDAQSQNKGKKAAATEPVPLWLFEDMGLEPVTPPEFLSAIEEGNDAPPLVFKKAQDQLKNKEVAILGYNTQATNEQAESLKKAADDAGIPVVDMAETMPKDSNYVDWISGYVDEVNSALK